nr:hypothetical protein GCM10025730_49840 [Promicromonospora thailandica]
MQSRRPETLTTHLIRAGFADLTRSATLWQDPDLVAVLDRRDRTGAAPGGGPDRGAVALDPAGAALLRALAAAADPDLALLQLVRLAAAAPDRLRALLTAPDDRTEPRDPETGGGPDEPAGVGAPARPAARDRLVRVLGASSALGDELVRHPALLGVLADPAPGTGIPPRDVRAELLRAVDADPDSPAPVAGTHPGTHPVGAGEAAAADTSPSYTDRLRRAYRARLLRIAATDVTAPDPTAVLPAVAAALADLAAAALEEPSPWRARRRKTTAPACAWPCSAWARPAAGSSTTSPTWT